MFEFGPLMWTSYFQEQDGPIEVSHYWLQYFSVMRQIFFKFVIHWVAKPIILLMLEFNSMKLELLSLSWFDVENLFNCQGHHAGCGLGYIFISLPPLSVRGGASSGTDVTDGSINSVAWFYFHFVPVQQQHHSLV